MKVNSQSLAMRDPALAAIMGALPNSGSDFGREFGTDDDDDDDDVGYDFGDDDDDFGAAKALAIAKPSKRAMAKAWMKGATRKARANKREMMLNPNKDSALKVERYSFSINQSIVLGVGTGLALTGTPDTWIRPERIVMNAPTPAFVEVAELKVGNVSGTVGGIGDAFEYSSVGVGVELDLPLMSPSTKATMLGTYTGFVPPGFVGGAAFRFAVSLKGSATISPTG